MSDGTNIEFTGNKITQYEGYGDMSIHIENGRLNLEKEEIDSCLLDKENKNRKPVHENVSLSVLSVSCSKKHQLVFYFYVLKHSN